MVPRVLASTGLSLSPVGFGAFKIGRNQGIKYAHGYALPDDDAVAALLNGLLDMGVNYIDTAPAYGVSDARIGKALADRRDQVVLSTKVGELFADGRSTFDYSAEGVRASLARSREHLRRDVLDVVFIHSDGNDDHVLRHTDAVATLADAKAAGHIRAIGFSGKSVAGAQAALEWADVLMVEYHRDDRSHEGVIAQAAARGVGVVVKKGLASGRIGASEGVRFVLGNRGVASMVVGTLSLDHMRENLHAAEHLITRVAT